MAATFTVGSGTGAQVFTLPPQTTPFSVPYANGVQPCVLSVYCPRQSYQDYSLTSTLTGPCLAVQPAAGYFNKSSSVVTQVGNPASCYPDGYFDLFNNEDPTLNSRFEITSTEGQLSTAAYPGGNCLSGWTTACTTTVMDAEKQYPQAWCCPVGFSCTTGVVTGGQERLCASAMSEPTQIWMSYDPPADASTLYTWIANVRGVPAGSAVAVFHKVFPLQIDATKNPATNSSAHNSIPISTGTAGTAGSQEGSQDDPRFPASIIAAIVIGIVVFFIISSLISIFYYRKRSKSKAKAEEIVAVQPEQEHQGKAELEASFPVTRAAIPKAELEAHSMERDQSLSEMTSNSPNGGQTVSVLESSCSGMLSQRSTLGNLSPQLEQQTIRTTTGAGLENVYEME